MSDGDSPAPSPTSPDPVRPGVLVHRAVGQPSQTPPPQYMLTIGTLANLRDVEGAVDGPGIVMWVRSVTETGFRGTWEPWGAHSGGQGYFCATKVE